MKMKIFGRELELFKPKLSGASGGGWFNVVQESFTGAWQRNIEVASPRAVLAFSAVFACVTTIASDIGKLRVKHMKSSTNDVGVEIKTGSIAKLLRKPNNYQNYVRFFVQWTVCKLLFGNTYVLKVRDNTGAVVKLFILDPQRVTASVTSEGDIWYRLMPDNMAGLDVTAIAAPASEIIHDMMPALWHPLCGVSPIYACGVSATQGSRIQTNSTKFFDNMSRPSGMLIAAGPISDETAVQLKKMWDENFSGANIGRTAVLGDGLKYEAMTIPAQQAQLIEQLKWTVEDVARAFRMPLFKIGGAQPSNNTVEVLNQIYYSDCLQSLIESMEASLDEGLELKESEYIEVDLDGLLRMDTAARYDAINKAIGGGWMTPNEGRAKNNLLPVTGGDTPYMQQQNYSLEALNKRDTQEDPFSTQARRRSDKTQLFELPALTHKREDEEIDMSLLTSCLSQAFIVEA